MFPFLSSANVSVLKSAQKSRFVNHSKSKNQMWNVSHHKIIGARRLAYWSWLIFETKETKGYSNTAASYSLPRYFWPQKTEVKPEFSKKLDEVFLRSNRRYKLQFHRGSIAENAPILSSGTVHVDKSVLVENRPLVKLIRNYISLVRISMVSFPSFTLSFVQKCSCLYNKKKITRWLEDVNFIFSW